MFMGIYGSLKYVHTCVVARLPACAEKQLNQTIITTGEISNIFIPLKWFNAAMECKMQTWQN